MAADTRCGVSTGLCFSFFVPKFAEKCAQLCSALWANRAEKQFVSGSVEVLDDSQTVVDGALPDGEAPDIVV